MSDGKSFAPKKILSDEERLEDVERKFGVVLERIQAYDKILKEFEVIRHNHNALCCDLREAIHQGQESGRELKDLISSVSWVSNNNQNKVSQLEDGIKLLDSRIQDVFRVAEGRADSISKDLEIREEHFRRLLESKISRKQFEEYQSSQKEFYTNNEINNQKTKEHLLSLQASISYISKEFEKKLEMLAEHGKAIQTFLIWINGFEDKVAQKLQQSQSDFSRRILDDNEDVLEKLQEMKKELIGTPMSNASVEKRILNRLEANTIESANAVRMMSTNQDRIKLLEKKVESLTTQLTKYEIK